MLAARKNVLVRCFASMKNISTRRAFNVKNVKSRLLLVDFSPKTAPIIASPIINSCMAQSVPLVMNMLRVKWFKRWERHFIKNVSPVVDAINRSSRVQRYLLDYLSS